MNIFQCALFVSQSTVFMDFGGEIDFQGQKNLMNIVFYSLFIGPVISFVLGCFVFQSIKVAIFAHIGHYLLLLIVLTA